MPSITAAPPAMSPFMSSMYSGRLDRDAAGVEGDRLADEAEDEAVAARRGGLVAEDDQARLGCGFPARPPRTRPSRARRSRRGREPRRRASSEACAISAARSASRSGVRSFGGRFARSRARFVQCATRSACSRQVERRVVAADQDQAVDLPRRGLRRLPARLVVAAEDDPVDDRACLLGQGSGSESSRSQASVPPWPRRATAAAASRIASGVELRSRGPAPGGDDARLPSSRWSTHVLPAVPGSRPTRRGLRAGIEVGEGRGGSMTAKAVTSASAAAAVTSISMPRPMLSDPVLDLRTSGAFTIGSTADTGRG